MNANKAHRDEILTRILKFYANSISKRLTFHTPLGVYKALDTNPSLEGRGVSLDTSKVFDIIRMWKVLWINKTFLT